MVTNEKGFFSMYSVCYIGYTHSNNFVTDFLCENLRLVNGIVFFHELQFILNQSCV